VGSGIGSGMHFPMGFGSRIGYSGEFLSYVGDGDPHQVRFGSGENSSLEEGNGEPFPVEKFPTANFSVRGCCANLTTATSMRHQTESEYEDHDDAVIVPRLDDRDEP
jgi:hypothetical protein